MKSSLFFTLPALCVLAISGCQPTGGSTMDPAQVKAEIQALEDAWAKALNTRDLDALMALYTDDALSMADNGPMLKGKDAIRKDQEKDFARQPEGMTFAFEVLDVYGDGPTVTETGRTTYTDGDGKVTGTGKYMVVWAKEGNTYRCAREIYNDDSPQGSNAAVIDGLYQAFAQGNIEAALAPMATGIVWNEAEGFPYADRNPYIGPQAVREGVFARIGAEWEYWNLSGIQLHEVGDNMVLATLRYDAKHKQTGRVLDAQTAHLWTLAGGKIVAFQQYTDTRQASAVIR